MVGHLCGEHDGGRQKHDEIKRLYDSEQFYYAAEYHSSKTQYFELRKMLCYVRQNYQHVHSRANFRVSIY